MGDNSKIEWTDASWNPVVGCSIVSPGCMNCYAMRQAARISTAETVTGDRTTVLMPDGELLQGERVFDHPGEDGWIVKRVGKRQAGRILDGREHNGIPEVGA